MAQPTIEALRSAILTARAKLTAPLEGMQDFARVAQGSEAAMAQAATAIAQEIQGRLDVAAQALTMLDTLEASRALEAPMFTLAAELQKGFDAQLESMAAARAVTQLPEATGGSVAFDPTDTV